MKWNRCGPWMPSASIIIISLINGVRHSLKWAEPALVHKHTHTRRATHQAHYLLFLSIQFIYISHACNFHSKYSVIVAYHLRRHRCDSHIPTKNRPGIPPWFCLFPSVHAIWVLPVQYRWYLIDATNGPRWIFIIHVVVCRSLEIRVIYTFIGFSG